MSGQREATEGGWWICDGALKDGGRKMLGPFESRDLALHVRMYVEKAEAPRTFWIDQAAPVRAALLGES